MKIATTKLSTEKEFKLVSPGKYVAKISRVTERTSENTGSKYIQVAFEVLPSKKHTMGGNAVFENFMVDHPNEDVLVISQQRAEKVGKAIDHEILEPGDLLASGILNKELLIEVVHKEKQYNGELKTYANVKKFDSSPV